MSKYMTLEKNMASFFSVFFSVTSANFFLPTLVKVDETLKKEKTKTKNKKRKEDVQEIVEKKKSKRLPEKLIVLTVEPY